MKKKLVTTLMALVLTLSLAMPAFAYTEYGLLYDATDLLDADFASTMGENTMYAFTARNAGGTRPSRTTPESSTISMSTATPARTTAIC